MYNKRNIPDRRQPDKSGVSGKGKKETPPARETGTVCR